MADQVPVTGEASAATVSPDQPVVDQVAMVSRAADGTPIQTPGFERVLPEPDAAVADLAQGVDPDTGTPLEHDEAMRVRDEVRGAGGASPATANPARDVEDATTDAEREALTEQSTDRDDHETAAGPVVGPSTATGPKNPDKS